MHNFHRISLLLPPRPPHLLSYYGCLPNRGKKTFFLWSRESSSSSPDIHFPIVFLLYRLVFHFGQRR